jgi:uncharacterized protein YuzE
MKEFFTNLSKALFPWASKKEGKTTWDESVFAGYIPVSDGEYFETQDNVPATVNVDRDIHGNIIGVEVILHSQEIHPVYAMASIH